jgi:hypothetical protein
MAGAPWICPQTCNISGSAATMLVFSVPYGELTARSEAWSGPCAGALITPVWSLCG